MNSNLLKILLPTDKKKLEERRKKRKVKLNADEEKARLERKIWEMAEEYEDD